MSKAVELIEKTIDTAGQVLARETGNIALAAKACAEALKNGGMIYTFGTGHSHLLAEEIFYRAGGLVKVCPVSEEPLMLHAGAFKSSELERLTGYAEIIAADIGTVGANDVMFLFSNSGRNTVSIEMALCMREKGVKTICITNLRHTKGVRSRHQGGKLLYEVCDIVIDNCGVSGDAAIEVGDIRCGPTSTAIGAMILQAVCCGTIEMLRDAGCEPEVFASANIDGGDELNRTYRKKYGSLIKKF